MKMLYRIVVALSRRACLSVSLFFFFHFVRTKLFITIKGTKPLNPTYEQK